MTATKLVKISLILISALALTVVSVASHAADTQKSFYDFSARTITGENAPLSKYKGKVALVVNVASKCGFTSQYKGLEELYQKYKDKGFVVLGFPSNDFFSQEPGTDQEIKSFCELNFGVTFPLFSKSKVHGSEKTELYKYLTEQSPKVPQGEIGWNFEKFIIGKDGQAVARFKSRVKPQDKSIIDVIEQELSKK